MIGKTLAHYEILEKIGAGGMGEVFRARDTRLDRDVALKVLPLDSARDTWRLKRFEREARAIAALNHPNIVTIHSLEDSGGINFLTMELVKGQTLGDYLPATGLPLDRFLEIAIPLADALSYAHSHGITHRDLKPANIMLDEEMRPKILDFGLAKLWLAPTADAEDTILADAPITKDGTIAGTFAYMSPEQISGGAIDGRSDIFSLGIIFHELLSGVSPFRGDHPAEIMHNILHDEAPYLPKVPAGVSGIVERCLRKSPADRFASAVDLRCALQDIAGSSASEATLPQTPPSDEAQKAYDRKDWTAAYEHLHAAAAERELSPAELEMLGTCASWLNKFTESTQTWERAYAAFKKAGQNISAARVALLLVGMAVENVAPAIARGWLKRAERLLQDQPACIERGYLLRRQTVVALEKCEFTHALELNRQVAGIATQFQDSDLQSIALHDHGQILVARGDVEEGMGLIDEAMIAAVSGEVGPATLGSLYCRTMIVCRSLADFNRVREWSEAARRWCDSYPVAGFRGVCRIHSAETMRHHGHWQEAEQTARSACADFEKSGINGHAGEAFNELGELALRKGDHKQAEEAFLRAHGFGYDPVPGLPLLRLAQGRHQAALQIIQRALSENRDDRLRRAKLLISSVGIALANGEVKLASELAEELGNLACQFDSPCFRAHALLGHGTVELEKGDIDAATSDLHRAWSIFHEVGFTYEAARARILLATAYLQTENQEDARLQLEAAVRTFSELGAMPDLAAAERLLAETR